VGASRRLVETRFITDLGGWAAAMPIVAVGGGAFDLAEARAAGISVVIPRDVDQSAVYGALAGAMATDSRNATWWVD
jgi:hypothetical protein